MTRRGTLTYYFAAVVVGCFFASAGFSLVGRGPNWHGAASGASSFREFFLLYFLSIPFGGFAAIVFAFLLRRLASWPRFRHAFIWALAGGGLAPGLVWLAHAAMAVLRLYGGSGPIATKIALVMIWLTLGAELMLPFWWVMIPAGALTALVLHRIHGAFETKPEPAN